MFSYIPSQDRVQFPTNPSRRLTNVHTIRPRLKRCAVATAIVAAGLTIAAPVAHATTGPAVDTTFGTGGSFTLPAGDHLDFLTVDQHNRPMGILDTDTGTNNYVAFRLTANGVPDTTFGTGGYLNLTGIPDYPDVSLVNGANGSIYVQATTSDTFNNPHTVITKLTSSGQPDLTFGSNGTLTPPNGCGGVELTGLEPNGDLYGMDITEVPGPKFTGQHTTICVLTPTGALDTTFNPTGPTPGTLATGRLIIPLILDNDGRFVGAAGFNPGDPDPFNGNNYLIRYTATGALDTTFGTDGVTESPIDTTGSNDPADLMTIDPATDGTYYVGGDIEDNCGDDCGHVYIAHYTAAGVRDTAFGTGGFATGPLEGCDPDTDWIQPDTTNILSIGSAGQCGALVDIYRWNTNGTPDTTFANGGTYTTPGDCYDDFTEQTTGDILVGSCTSTTDSTTVITAINPTPTGGGGTTGGNPGSGGNPGGGSGTGTGTTVPTPAAPSPPTISRYAGVDRYSTAVAISQADYPSGNAGAVVLATGTDYPDALVAAPLATTKNAPLLLTTGATLPTATKTEIQRVLPAGGTVYILGGITAIPASITTELTTLGYHVVRYAGTNRYNTATDVADALGDPTTVLLATGTDYPDALTAGPAAAHIHGAVLLTNGTILPTETSTYLTAHPGTTYAIGGPAASADPKATAVAGTDRYTTATDVATKFFTTPTTVGIATGDNYPDALAGGTQLAHTGAPLLLVDTTSLPTATSEYLTGVKGTIRTTQMYGGTTSINTVVQTDVQTALGQ